MPSPSTRSCCWSQRGGSIPEHVFLKNIGSSLAATLISMVFSNHPSFLSIQMIKFCQIQKIHFSGFKVIYQVNIAWIVLIKWILKVSLTSSSNSQNSLSVYILEMLICLYSSVLKNDYLLMVFKFHYNFIMLCSILQGLIWQKAFL